MRCGAPARLVPPRSNDAVRVTYARSRVWGVWGRASRLGTVRAGGAPPFVTNRVRQCARPGPALYAPAHDAPACPQATGRARPARPAAPARPRALRWRFRSSAAPPARPPAFPLLRRRTGSGSGLAIPSGPRARASHPPSPRGPGPAPHDVAIEVTAKIDANDPRVCARAWPPPPAMPPERGRSR
jgi:hypothetical protein